MVSPSAGAIILVPFPFSDLSQAKLRPALVLADSGRGDWILAQVTSKPYGDPHAIELQSGDFASGSVLLVSYVRPTKLFTLNQELIRAEVARLKPQAFAVVVEAIIVVLHKAVEQCDVR
ncbi:MAG TPA: type II toxin-antitoxin system PemK/MazF family toxin [Sedimentisphaerales bacterium]|nr:type II toxin-antitoxin system PemK/MazF family toxin [Sedimentisphaerales bacterium]